MLQDPARPLLNGLNNKIPVFTDIIKSNIRPKFVFKSSRISLLKISDSAWAPQDQNGTL